MNAHQNKLKSILETMFKQSIPLEEFEILAPYYKRETIKRKTTIFMNGEPNVRHYFIEKGLLRLYINDANGREYNILFAKENQVIGDLSTPSPTQFNLGTIEASTVWSISEESFAHLNEKTKLFNGIRSANQFRRNYIFLQKRLVSILTKTAEENYLALQSSYPQLLQRLPQYHIASYLGVSAEFLSKIVAKTLKQ